VGGRGGSGRAGEAKSEAKVAQRMREDLAALMRTQSQLGPEQQIQRAYQDLVDPQIPWVGLRELRDRLSGLTREQQDTALTNLVRERLIRLIPEENQKTITLADRAAAISLSGEPKHLIAFQNRLR
jgi:uncharacterized membrane-anchored protein YjiN (DUF445 family)